MSQAIPVRCPQCGAEAVPKQRFCPNCGLKTEEQENVAGPALLEGEAKVGPGGEAKGESQARSIVEAISEVPTERLSAKKRSSRRILLWILNPILILLLVIGGILGWLWYQSHVQPEITIQNLREQVYYAGLIYQIERVERSQKFLDDLRSSESGMVRIEMRVQNPYNQPFSLAYDDSVRLLVSKGKSLRPVSGTLGSVLKAGGVQAGYLDFSVPIETALAQLHLQLGRAGEAQVVIPLNRQADLRASAPRMQGLKGTLAYQGLNWNLISESSEQGREGKQAKQGTRYLTLELQVDNPLEQIVIPGSPFDYMRLTIGGQSIMPEESSLPVSFEAGETGKGGTVTFIVPENAKEATLILVGQPQNGFDQATQGLALP